MFRLQQLFPSLPVGGANRHYLICLAELLSDCSLRCTLSPLFTRQVYSPVRQPGEQREEEGRGEEEEQEEEVERAERGGGEGQQRERVHRGVHQHAAGQR